MAEGNDKSIEEKVREENNKVILVEQNKELEQELNGLNGVLLRQDDTTRSIDRRQTDIADTIINNTDATKQLHHDFELSRARQNSQLVRAEKQLRHIDAKVKQVKTELDNLRGSNGYLPWKIHIDNIKLPTGNVGNRLSVQSSGILKFHNGLQTWEFRLFLNSDGLNRQFVSLTVTLVSSPSQLSNIFPGTLTVRLVNMDQIHPPTDSRTPRQDICSTIEPGRLSNSHPSVTINNFFPHRVFGLAQGFVIEEHVLIEAKAEMSEKALQKKQDDEWLMDNDSCEPFESSS